MPSLDTVGYTILSIGLLLIVISIVLCFIWRVPSLVDELSGRKAKRQIERMKRLNIASSSLTAMNTAEFYKSVIDGERISLKEDSLIGDNVNNSSELSKLVNDPYNSVGSKKSEVTEVNGIEKSYPDDEIATDFFDNFEVRDKGDGLFNIVIIEEQSSLN